MMILLKNPVHPSTTLRANGNSTDSIDDLPFMLSPSKHGELVFQQHLMTAPRKILPSESGQALVELGLILPLLLVLALGAIEISNIIYTYLVLTHLTREGGNMISRGTPANDALDAIVDSSAPVITLENGGQWRIFYSLIRPSEPAACLADPVATNPACAYVVEPPISRGSLIGVTSAIGTGTLPSVAPGSTYYAVEVFYLYAPITPLAGFGVAIAGGPFYERAIF